MIISGLAFMRCSPVSDDGCAHAHARCYLLLCMVRHLLQVINPTSSLPKRMQAHLKTFPDLNHLGLNLVGMGAGADWEAQW